MILILSVLFSLGFVTNSQKSFSLESATRNWFYYSASLCDPSRLGNWDVGTISEKYPNFTEVKVVYNRSGEALAYLSYDVYENSIYVVFRGSIEKLENWMDNAKIYYSDYPPCLNCKVDHGFLNHYLDLKDGIFENLRTFLEKYPSSMIRIIGHSLGATGATLLAADVKREFASSLESIYTFGSPRVGNKEFVDWWNSQMNGTFNVRITRKRDPGTLL
jgi:predicted lipase